MSHLKRAAYVLAAAGLTLASGATRSRRARAQSQPGGEATTAPSPQPSAQPSQQPSPSNGPSSAPVQPARPLAFSLESSSGGTTTLASLRGRVVVLFYETREHTEDNDELKGVLRQYIRDNRLTSDVEIVPAANVSGFDFHPASDFARAAIRRVARDIGLAILMDWNGVLQTTPWSLTSDASNVVVIDRAGQPVFRHAGVVTGETKSAFFRAIRRAIRDGRGAGTQGAAGVTAR